jgi:AAA+ ATPase superfamily predicted ATPase
VFLNRNQELKILESLFELKKASLAVCKGRRRIGKSRLIEEFGKKASKIISIQGLAPREGITKKDQLAAFGEQLSQTTSLPPLAPESWSQAFSLLNSVIGKSKTVVLLDEISWMSVGEKDFAGFLKIAWDKEFSKNPRLILVLCGSVSSWIEKNILNNTGFRGRVSVTLNVGELGLEHCDGFWGKYSKNVSAFEKLKLLSVVGGVPKYLEEINPRQSAESNIKRLCYQPEGYLFNEFDELFRDSFGKRASIYKTIIEKLSTGFFGIEDISAHMGWKKGGRISEYLNDLTKSGFISRHAAKVPGKKISSKNICYRLSDNYLRFYLKYLNPVKDQINSGIYHYKNIETLPEWETIMGFQFENLVLNNIPSVCHAANINLETVISAGPYFQKQTKQRKGCQIDLLIETQYTLYVCEIKFRKKTDNSIIDEITQKISRLKYPVSLSIRPILIYAGSITSNVEKSDFFASIISFEKLLTAKE